MIRIRTHVLSLIRIQPGPEALNLAVAEKNFCYVLCQEQQFKRLAYNFPIIVFADFSQRCHVNL
jgi:hypothetical protein